MFVDLVFSWGRLIDEAMSHATVQKFLLAQI